MGRRVLSKEFETLLWGMVTDRYEDIGWFLIEYYDGKYDINKVYFRLVYCWDEYDALTEQDKEEIENYILKIFNQGKELFYFDEMEFGGVCFVYEV